MSFPAAATISLGSAAVANPLDIVMASVNSNPYFIGIMMLLLNLGGRFLALEISKDQEKFLSHPVVRRFFLFAVLFMGTRNLIISSGLTIIVIILLGYLFNENSELCLWHSCINKPEVPKQEGFVGLTPEEGMILKRLQDKQSASASQAKEAKEDTKEKPPQKAQATAASLYSSALTQLAS